MTDIHTFHPPYTGKPIPEVPEETIKEAVTYTLALLERSLAGPQTACSFLVITIPLNDFADFSYPALAHAMLRVANQGWGVSFVNSSKRDKGSFQFTNYKQSKLYADLLAFQTSTGQNGLSVTRGK